MKGSPLLSTLIAILLMAGSYLWFHSSLGNSSPSPNKSKEKPTNSYPNQEITCYIEAHFSSPPTHFTISDPISGDILAQVTHLEDNEWSDEITLSQKSSPELTIKANWKHQQRDTANQNFIQLVLSPDQREDSSVTLRSPGAIDTTATFQLRQ